jgi:hypothetical protein
MRLFVLTLASCCAAGTLACSRADRPVTLDTIIARNTLALGGEVALASVQSVWRQRNAQTFTLRQRPTRHLVVLLNDTGGIRYAEGYDGQTAWEIVDDGPKQEATERARVALWHTTQFPSVLNPLFQMSALGHELRLVGSDTVEGVHYYKLLLALSDGFEREYFVNARTGHIERARDIRRLHAYEDDVQPIESLWSDFREVDGVWLPFTSGERNYETGERLSGGTMRQARVNVSVPEEVFALDGSLAPSLRLIRELTGEP